MERRFKTFAVKLDAVEEADGTGQFEAVVSIFNNVDLVGDKVLPGAFAKSLARWKESGDPIPVIWSHNWDDPDAHIGQVLEAEEREDGLWIKGQLDLEEDGPRKIHKLLSQRRVKEFSFAYDVIEERPGKEANELVELDLIEVGPTLKCANPSTQLLGVKAHTKYYGALEGSVEERQAKISEAIAAAHGGEDTWTWIVATYPEKVVFSVETLQQATEYYEASYTVDGDTVTLGERVPVQINATVVRKARPSKAGRVLSKTNEEKIANARELLDEVLSAVSSEDEAGKASGKADEPERVKAEGRDPRDLLLVEHLERLAI